MKNTLLKVFTCIFALSTVCLFSQAQTKQASHEFSAFDSIDIEYDFNVNVVKSDRDYSVSLSVDDVLMEYVQTYVKNHTLYIAMDKKNLPSDIKKLYKGRKSPDPVLNATVYVGSNLKSINIRGGASLYVSEEIECKDFELNVTENATVKKLEVDASEFTYTSNNKAKSELVVYADKITIKADGNSSLNMEQDSEKLDIIGQGNCDVKVNGEALETSIKTSASASVAVIGKTNKLAVTTNGSSKVDALNLKTPECSVDLSGNSRVTEAASDKLDVTMSTGSTLVFDGDPAINIINVKNASISRFEGTKK
ncbi:MAG: DUF2807 domain-containing protein [Bacteroidia bacterium]|nr:DUF2807 domain-containing protein [Bacteroidia bacterium]